MKKAESKKDLRFKISDFRFEAGASLVEMLIAISIVVVALLGILVLVNRSLGLNKVTNEFYTATYLASEGIEITKNLFDRSFLETTKAKTGSRDFYGWVGLKNIAPVASRNFGIYQMDFQSKKRPSSINCSFGGKPTEANVRKLVFSSCLHLKPLQFDDVKGVYLYDNSKKDTKFKRVIIIDKPTEYPSQRPVLDYRVTSAVGWESRGGKFFVHLQDHFLPWRLP